MIARASSALFEAACTVVCVICLGICLACERFGIEPDFDGEEE